VTSGANSLGSTPRIDGSSLRETGHRQFLALLTLLTRSGNPSSYKAVIEANESGRPAVEKLEPFYPGLVVIVAVRGSHLKGGFCTPHVPDSAVLISAADRGPIER